MREDRGEVARLAVVGVAVQEDHVHWERLQLSEEVREQCGVGQVHREVRVTEPRVDLQGEPSLPGHPRAGPDAEPQQDRIGQPWG